jgi:hypothetical protein
METIRYTAETYCVLNTGETGWCVKLGDDTICDVYGPEAEEQASLIARLLNEHEDYN